jgi:transposase-like protein
MVLNILCLLYVYTVFVTFMVLMSTMIIVLLYLLAVKEMRKEKNMPSGIQLRQKKYFNNIVEQDHRFIKKGVRSMLGLKLFRTATYILSGIGA